MLLLPLSPEQRVARNDVADKSWDAITIHHVCDQTGMRVVECAPGADEGVALRIASHVRCVEAKEEAKEDFQHGCGACGAPVARVRADPAYTTSQPNHRTHVALMIVMVQGVCDGGRGRGHMGRWHRPRNGRPSSGAFARPALPPIPRYCARGTAAEVPRRRS